MISVHDFLGRLLRVHLITLEGVWNVRQYVRKSRKSFSDFNEILYVDKGQSAMHEGYAGDPIQGEGQECLKATQEEWTVSPARD